MCLLRSGLRNSDGLNFYAYVYNDALNREDPTGTEAADALSLQRSLALIAGSRTDTGPVSESLGKSGNVVNAGTLTGGAASLITRSEKVANVTERVAKAGDVITVAKATSELAEGKPEETAKTAMVATVDKVVGVAVGIAVALTGQEELVPAAKTSGEALSSTKHIGDKTAYRTVEAAKNQAEVEAQRAASPGSPRCGLPAAAHMLILG